MKDSVLYNVLRPFIKIFTCVFIHPKYNGLENISKDVPIILAGNHTSILDPLVLISATRRNIHFLAKDELWKGLKKIIFSNLGLIPVNRREKDKFALCEAEKYLEDGKVVGIFPEGTTNKKAELLPFKIGAVKMAYDMNVKIIPFVITGSYNVFKKLTVSFGKPILIDGYDLKKANDSLRNTIKNMKEEM